MQILCRAHAIPMPPACGIRSPNTASVNVVAAGCYRVIVVLKRQTERIMAKPRWHHMLLESQRHALKAVDEWNYSAGSYSDFITHMNRAWHYLLHAEFRRDKIDYHYVDPKTGKHTEIDGEQKAWALEDCVKRRYERTNNPVRLNIELFIKLRNKVEHRYEHGFKVVTGGKAHALVINYETEITEEFGSAYSLADRLRFPIFLRSITATGQAGLREIASKLPRHTRELIARYEAGLDQTVLDDLQYDYRVRLVPMIGPKTDADLAVNFVQLSELTEDERKIITEAGRTGTVIIRDRQVEVATKDKLRPTQVAKLVEEQLPFHFTTADHTAMWKKLKVRPLSDTGDPYQTEAKYCVYDEPFRSYVYTPAWVKRIVKEIGTANKYRSFINREPRMKVSGLAEQLTNTSKSNAIVDDKPA